MRLIGNKSKLVGQIEEFLARRGVLKGTFLDVFAGTGSVARHFRRQGFRVRANDLLASSYARQRSYVAQGRYPSFHGVLALPEVNRFLARRAGERALAALGPGPVGSEPLAKVLAFLGHGAELREGLVFRQYAQGGCAERLFFSAANGRRLDAIQETISTWLWQGCVSAEEFYLLLTSLLEAADRVANISGTYGAFLKQLQASARERLSLRVPLLDTRAPAGRVYREDANQLVRRLKVDTLYLDPPYNQRQYAKNYHVLEVLAELHEVEDLKAYEAEIYGKTGLRAFGDRLSSYCRKASRRRGQPSPCEEAFRDLVTQAGAEHIVVSYSEEGILDLETIGDALAQAAGQRRFDFERDHLEISYRRFRSDKDDAGRRNYRVLEGRSRDEVREWLFYVRKPAVRSRKRLVAS